MAKIIDITDKLNFDENPKIRIRKTEIEVNADAATMLKIMGVISENKEPTPNDVLVMYELLFSDKEREKIEKFKLSFSDFQNLVFAAITLVTGEESGEQ